MSTLRPFRAFNDNLRFSEFPSKTPPKGGRQRLDWKQTAINLAFDIANYRSEDPYTQVGACALRKDGFEVGLGYNGPPSGVDIDWADRNAKNERVLHAEANVLNRCLPGDVELIAVTHMPCKICIRTIAQKKIKIVIYCIRMPNYEPELVEQLAKEFGIELIQMNPTTKNAPERLEYIRQ